MGLINLKKKGDIYGTFLAGTTKYVFKWDMGYPVVKKMYTRRETNHQSQLSLSLSLSQYIYVYIYICVCVCVCVCVGRVAQSV